MSELKTIKVWSEAPSGFTVINESDFNKKTMRLFEEAPPVEVDQEEMPDDIEAAIFVVTDQLATKGIEIDLDELVDEVMAAREAGTLSEVRAKYLAMIPE